MDNRYIFIKGDVSGIQPFIFNVKSKGAARELKGRSFFIKLLVEVAIQYILDQFKITETDNIFQSKISTSGGNFILKLPVRVDIKQLINLIQDNFTYSLRYTGLNLIIAYTDKTDNYCKDLVQLDAKCREEKYHIYHHDFSYFEPFSKTETNLSQKWITFTDLVKNKNAFEIFKNPNPERRELKFNNSTICLVGYEIRFNDHEKGILIKRFLEGLFPKHNGEIIQFECLSKSTQYHTYINTKGNCNPVSACSIMENGGDVGLEKLGILALDVDGLGNYLCSIQSEDEHRESDQKLRSFFNDRISEIINNDQLTYNFYKKLPPHNPCKQAQINLNIPKFRNKIYSVTAGGDDSFFVGKWNTILDFAIIINTEFTSSFPGVSISAGMIVVDPKFPVVRFAELAENALKKAKYGFNTKGNICLFGEVLKWEALKEINELREILKKENLSGSQLAKARVSANNIDDFSQFTFEDFWKIGYYLRDVKAKQKILNILERLIEKSLLSKDKLTQRNYRKILPIAAMLAELDHR